MGHIRALTGGRLGHRNGRVNRSCLSVMFSLGNQAIELLITSQLINLATYVDDLV